MINILLQVLILCVVVGVVWWVLDFVPVPDPLNKIAKVVIMVVAIVILVYLLIGLAAHAPALP
jgi:hypothetical protein